MLLHSSRITRSFYGSRLAACLATLFVLLLSVLSFPPVTHADSPPNLSSNIAWSAGLVGVADIQTAFNNGRRQERSSLALQ